LNPGHPRELYVFNECKNPYGYRIFKPFSPK